MPLKQKIKGLVSLSTFFVVFSFLFISKAFTDSPQVSKTDKSSSWSQYGQDNSDFVPDSAISNAAPLPQGPGTDLSSLDQYKASPQENPLTVALKADDMIDSLSNPLVDLDTDHSITDNDAPGSLMEKADQMSSEATQMYAGIQDMNSEIDTMKQQLKSNYDTFNGSAKSSQDANQLNSQSDAMADQVVAMQDSIKGMAQQAQNSSDLINEMYSGLDQMAQNGQQSEAYYDQLIDHIKDAANQFEGMANDLQSQGLGAPDAFSKARQYFSSLEQYVQAHKPYTNKEIDYVQDVKDYLQKIQGYLNKVASDIGNVENSLNDLEQYFRNAKVKPVSNDNSPLQPPGPAAAPNVCSSLISDDPTAGKGQPLESRDQCQKTCHSGCREERKAGGPTCYACPSGSPDTCYDVGALPADVSWCQPGGICDTNPELYCTFFGAIGPNKMQLNCATCKQIPDECWQKIGNNTTNLTHCIQTCPGLCTYEGKYKVSDKPVKFEHCYSCQMPPPAPTCESLGWGSSTLNMCTKDCPDGFCDQVTITIGKDGKPQESNPNGGQNGGNNGGQNGTPAPGGAQNGGQDGSGQGGGNNGGTQGGAGATPGGGDQGNQPNPPPQPPTDGSGGGGSVAGGDKTKGGTTTPPPGPTNPPTGGDNKPQNPPPAPKGGTQAKEPKAPNTQDKPKPPVDPNIPTPDTWEVNFYNNWLNQTKERIKSREDIINNPNEGEGTKDVARQQLAAETKTKEYLETKAKEAQEKVKTQQKEIDDKKKLIDDYEKTRPKTVDYAKEAEKRGKAWKLGKLKGATDNLKTIVKEAKDSADARKKQIDDTTKEIDRLKQENDDLSDTVTRGREGSEEAQKRTDDNNKRIQELTQDRSTLIKAFQKSQAKYKKEIDQATSDYRTALWQLDENARRKAEAERIDEYYTITKELQHRKQVQDERNKVFDTISQNLENAKKDAQDKGDTSTVDKLQQQEDNLKREQDDWNQTQTRQEGNFEEQLYQLGKRNFDEGAGPYSTESLNDKLNTYTKLLQDKLNDPNLTDDQKATVQATLDGIKDKQSGLQTQSLSDDEKQRVDDTTTSVANAAMDKDPDKSFLRLAGESIVEEAVHNMNPLVAAKKSVAFGWGVAQGIGSAVKGAVELGNGVTKLLVQSAASDLGSDAFGTDAVDTLSSVLTTGYNNANPDGLLKAVVAAGAVQDAMINDLQKSGDIDWATAEGGGKVAGNIIGGELLAPGAAGDLYTEAKALTQGGEAAVDAANAAATVDEAANAAATVEKTGVTPPTETTKFPPAEMPGETVTTPSPGEGTPSGSEAKTAPANPPEGGTQARAPPPEAPSTPSTPSTPATTVGPNSDLSFTQDGKTVPIKTGEELGHGSTSTAYVDANDPNKVIRVTTTGTTASPEVAKVDAAGRKAVETIEKPGGPIRIVKEGERYTVTDPNSPLKGKVVEINERVQGGSADKMLPKQGGTMTQGQAEAFDKATRELNDNGYAWLDNHTGNYGFEKVPGTTDDWKVVVIDPGGIVPMQGATTAEKALNARAIQTTLNVPDAQTLQLNKQMTGASGKRLISTEVRGEILQKFGDKIDAAAMGLDSSEKIPFYTLGTADYTAIQDLAKMSPEEAAAYYASKK